MAKETDIDKIIEEHLRIRAKVVKEEAERKAEEQAIADFIERMKKEFLAFFADDNNTKRANFTGSHNALAIPRVLADILELCEHYNYEPLPLYLEWLADQYVGKKCPLLIEWLEKIHTILVVRNYTRDNQFDHNDLDNKAFYIPHEKRKIVCLTGQTQRYLYVWDDNNLHIRFFYDVWKERDEWDKEEDDKIRNGGINAAIQQASNLCERWSDSIDGNKYPHRPSLDWFAKRDFSFGYSDAGCGYGDIRDIGFILSWGRKDYKMYGREAEKIIHTICDVKWAFFEVNCALTVLEEPFI